MGSEQSSQSARSQRLIKSVEKSVKDHTKVRSSSPRPSISSDSDIPYISYTVNRPIGGSLSFYPKILSDFYFHIWLSFYFKLVEDCLNPCNLYFLDSPKLSSKSPAHSLRASATPSPRSSPKVPRPKSYAGSTSGHDIVVVKEGVSNIETLDTDADYLKLKVT